MNRHNTSARRLIALGPNGEFWAPSALESREADRGENLPSHFLHDLEKMKDRSSSSSGGQWKDGLEPESVVFGMQQSYLITCKGGECLLYSSNLKDHYPNLCQRLQERFRNKGPDKRVVNDLSRPLSDILNPRFSSTRELWLNRGSQYDFITINPYARDEWVAVWADGSFSWSLSRAYSMIIGHISEWICNRFGGGSSSSSSSSGLSVSRPSSTPLTSTPPQNNPNSTSTALYNSTRPPYNNRYHSTPTPTFASTLTSQPPQTRPTIPSNIGIRIRPTYATQTYTSPAALPFTSTTAPVPAATNTNDASLGQISNFWSAHGDQMLRVSEILMNAYNASNSTATSTSTGAGSSGGWSSMGFDPSGTAATATPPTFFDPATSLNQISQAVNSFFGGGGAASGMGMDPTGGAAGLLFGGVGLGGLGC